jgi:HPt (histidine-containing phosphotransfer) domain-containing protein
MTDDLELERTLAVLRARYLADVPDHVAAMRKALETAGTGDQAALEQLRMLLHRMAGAAGTHGFHAATALARKAELRVKLLLEMAPPRDIGSLAGFETELDALAAAFRAGPGPG